MKLTVNDDPARGPKVDIEEDGSDGGHPFGASARRWPHRRLLQRGPSSAVVGHKRAGVAASGPGSVILVKRSRMLRESNVARELFRDFSRSVQECCYHEPR